MRMVLAALLAGSLGASHLALAQTQTTPAPSTAPSTAPTPATPSSGGTTAPVAPSASETQSSTTAPAQPATPMKQMAVSALTARILWAPETTRWVISSAVESNADKKQYLVISRGGFLGLFETEVLVPLENVAAQGDRIVFRNLTEEQVKALPKYTTDDKAYRNLKGSQIVSLNELK